MMAIACVLSLTACGETDEVTSNDYMTANQAISNAETYTTQVGQIYDEYADDLDSFYQTCKQTDTDDATLIMEAVESWSDATAELGDDITVVSGESTAEVSDDEIIVNVTVQGNMVDKNNNFRTATEQVIFTKTSPTSMTTTVNYTMSEMMATAGMNTVIGMATVFCILIIISIFISLMGFIPKYQAQMAKKKILLSEKEQTLDDTLTIESMDTIETTDDTELIAVISAAIAASEGTSSDGFVVRSIIRR